ncbi:MAG: protease modulator HflC [Pseudomonadota bacterium]
MSTAKNFTGIMLVIAGVVASQSVFTVSEKQKAIKFQFGEIVRADYGPGLHTKFPFVNSVVKFEDRVLTRTNPTEEFLTNEKKNLFVDFFVKWRITDVAQFYRATGGDELAGSDRLIEIIKDGIRGEFAKRTVVEVVSAERSELMDDMLEKAGETASELGISIVDVRVKRIDRHDRQTHRQIDQRPLTLVTAR